MDRARFGKEFNVYLSEGKLAGASKRLRALGKPRYVPSEQVVEIAHGVVRLSLTREQVAKLEEYLEPATNAQIEPESKSGFGERLVSDAREVEGELVAPTQRHEHSMNVWRRLAFFFRRLRR